jgi:hypothetical protein
VAARMACLIRGPAREGHHELHWTARICRTVWMTIAPRGLVAEMAFFYLAPVLTGAADICVAGGFDCVIAAHRGELKPLGRGARPPA